MQVASKSIAAKIKAILDKGKNATVPTSSGKNLMFFPLGMKNSEGDALYCVVLEGGGSKIFDPRMPIDEFILIQSGFRMAASRVISEIIWELFPKTRPVKVTTKQRSLQLDASHN